MNEEQSNSPSTWTRHLRAWKNRGLSLLEHWDQKTSRGGWARLRQAGRRYSQLDLPNMGAALAYYLIFALVPLVLFVASLILTFGQGLISREAVLSLRRLVPTEILQSLSSVLSNAAAWSSLSTTIGALALIWSASRGFNVLVSVFDRIYENPSSAKRFFIRQVLSLAAILVFGISLLLVLLLLSFSEPLLASLQSLFGAVIQDWSWLRYLGYLFSFTYLIGLFSVLLYICSKRRAPFRWALLTGAGIALSWVLLSFGFSIYIRHSARLSVIYGSITSIIILLLWLYLCANLLLVGALVHSEIQRWYVETSAAKPEEGKN